MGKEPPKFRFPDFCLKVWKDHGSEPGWQERWNFYAWTLKRKSARRKRKMCTGCLSSQVHLRKGAAAVDKQKLTPPVKYLLSAWKIWIQKCECFLSELSKSIWIIAKAYLDDLYAQFISRYETKPQTQVCANLFNPSVIGVNHTTTIIIQKLWKKKPYHINVLCEQKFQNSLRRMWENWVF